MNSRTVLVGLAGLVVCVGCARQNRVTLDGSRPGPIVEDRVPARAASAKLSDTDAVASPVTLVKKSDGVYVVNASETNYRVQLRTTPAVQNTTASGQNLMYVLVPAKSEVKLGSTDEWTYTIVGTPSKP